VTRGQGPSSFGSAAGLAWLAAAFVLLVDASPPDAPSVAASVSAAAATARAVPESARAARPPRGLWVLCEGSQRVLEHEGRVEVLLEDAEALGVTDLFVQVYRGGRAWFRTTLADGTPWTGLVREGGSDALAELIARAHARGLRVHAWVNVLNLASNPQAPIVLALGREAVIVDQKGRSLLDYPEYEVPPPDREWLRMGTPALWLDPAHSGVAERLAATFAELARGYPGLDGLHLDYVRYPDALPFSPGTQFGVGLGFGFGEVARARFQAETGLVAPFGSSLLNAERFDGWRREKLGALVAGIASAARAARPGLRVSAAVVAERERAYRVDLQDWLGWLDAGTLDFAVPMLYTRDPIFLRYGVETYAGLARRRALWVGLGSWLFADAPVLAVEQLRVASAEPGLGTALFSWDSIRETPALLSALATEVARERTPPAR
jgi:uncharacterized lipoprotein YddW (UPF0748 family)